MSYIAKHEALKQVVHDRLAILAMSFSMALLILTGVVLLSAGCNVDNEIESGKYKCTTDADCTWGWKCMETGGGQKVCVNPADPDKGLMTDAGLEDQQIQADQEPTLSDQGPTPDKGPGPDKGPVPDKGPTACTPNVATCVDLGHLKKCNSSGTGYLPVEACPSQKRCEAGACVNAADVVGMVTVNSSIFHDSLNPGTWKEQVWLDAWFNHNYNGSTGIPFDGGPVAIQGIPSGTRTLTYNASKQEYSASPALSPSQFPYGASLTFSGSGKNLVQAFSGGIAVPPKRLITQPAYVATHPKSQPLTIKWSGFTGQGQVRLDILDLGSAAPPMTMMMDDDGEHTIPASTLAPMSTMQPVGLVLIGLSCSTFTAPGLTSPNACGMVMHQTDVLLQ